MATPQMVTDTVDGVHFRASPRNEPRLVVEVTSDRAGTWSLCEQAIECPYPRNGKRHVHTQSIVIYERDLPVVQALVRTDAHEAMFASAMLQAPQTVPPNGEAVALGEQKRRALDKIERAKTEGERSREQSNIAEIENAIGREAVRILCLNPGMRDGLPPLLSARVVKRIGAPPTPENIAESANDRLAATLERLMDAREAKAAKKS